MTVLEDAADVAAKAGRAAYAEALRAHRPAIDLCGASADPEILKIFRSNTMRISREDEDLRLKCLTLAIEAKHGEPVEQARRFYDFVTGEGDKSPKQIITEALERAGVR